MLIGQDWCIFFYRVCLNIGVLPNPKEAVELLDLVQGKLTQAGLVFLLYSHTNVSLKTRFCG